MGQRASRWIQNFGIGDTKKSKAGDLYLRLACRDEENFIKMIEDLHNGSLQRKGISEEVCVAINYSTGSFEVNCCIVDRSQSSQQPGVTNDGKYLYLPINRAFPNCNVENRECITTVSPLQQPMPTTSAEKPSIILDSRWKETLRQYKKIRILSAGVHQEILDALRHELSAFRYEEEFDVTCIAVISTTRVQSDAEMALEKFGIDMANHGKNTILLMLHAVAGSKTIADVAATVYSCPFVSKTLHVPFKRD